MHISLEKDADSASIETLLDSAFGPSRHGRTVYVFREDVAPVRDLCFVARPEPDADINAVLRFWPVQVGTETGLLLGPLAVDPAFAGQGYGRSLMRHGIEQAFAQGWRVIVLVGEASYYGPFGFSEDLAAGLSLPGPMTPGRCLMAATADNLPPQAGEISKVSSPDATETSAPKRCNPPFPIQRQRPAKATG